MAPQTQPAARQQSPLLPRKRHLGQPRPRLFHPRASARIARWQATGLASTRVPFPLAQLRPKRQLKMYQARIGCTEAPVPSTAQLTTCCKDQSTAARPTGWNGRPESCILSTYDSHARVPPPPLALCRTKYSYIFLKKKKETHDARPSARMCPPESFDRHMFSPSTS